MYKYNPFIMQNIRANTLIIGANNNPINKKVRLNADFSINYKKTALLFAHLQKNNYVCTENSSVTCEVTEFFNKSIVGKGMPEMRNYSLFIF